MSSKDNIIKDVFESGPDMTVQELMHDMLGELDEESPFNKGLIILLDDKGDNYTTFIKPTSNMRRSEAIALLELIKTDLIKDITG